jgi:hypothetical protein
VVVVEHEDDLLGEHGEGVDQRRQHALQRRRPRLEQGASLGPDAGARRLQRGDDVAPEERRVVVARVERQPGDRAPLPAEPVDQQRLLAEAGRRNQERQRAGRTLLQARQQARASDQAGAPGRQGQLGAQQRRPRRGVSRSCR